MNAELFANELARQRDKYRTLLDITRQQQAVIDSGNVDALLQLAERKRGVLDEIEAIDKGILPWKREWRVLKKTLSTDEVARVERVVEEITTLLQELIRLEDATRQAGQKRQTETQDEMKDLKRKRQAFDAYKPQSEQEGSYLDEV